MALTDSHLADLNLAVWRCGDKTDEELSLFDWLNLAHCATQRAMAQAGLSHDGFYSEYHAARALAKKAAKY